MLVAQHEAQHLELVLALCEVARELLEGAELHRHLRRRAHPRYPKVWPHGVPLGVCRLDLEGGARAHSQNSEFLYGGRVERKGEPQLGRLYSDAHRELAKGKRLCSLAGAPDVAASLASLPLVTPPGR